MKKKNILCLASGLLIGLLGIVGCDDTSSEPSSEPTSQQESSSVVESSTPASESSSSSEVHTHAYGTIHPFVLPTETTDGNKAYYQCSCGTYFDKDYNETTWDALKIPAEKFEGATARARLNDVDDNAITIYDDTATDIALSDYTVAINASGKIIYASRTSDGYGGPGDGFYHDGTYDLELGETCGIFDVDENWNYWPATALVEGVEVNAWTLYTVVVPEGGYIMTGTQEQMTDLVQAITRVEEFDEAANALFESTIGDGQLNAYTIEVEKKSYYAGVKVIAPAYTDIGILYSGDVAGEFTKQADGTYTAVVTLEQWKHIIFTKRDLEGNLTTLWYDNTDFEGTFTAESVYNADWTSNLYHEIDEETGLEKIQFYCCLDDGCSYKLTYDPVAGKMTGEELIISEDKNAVIDASAEEAFTYDANSGLYTYHTKLQQWGKVNIGSTDENGYFTPFTFDTVTINGSIINDSNADWTTNLYLVSGGWMCSVEGGVDYYFTYDPQAKSLYVGVPNTLVDGAGGLATYDSDAGNYVYNKTLNTWGSVYFFYTDATGKSTQVTFDNTTITGKAKNVGDAPWTDELYVVEKNALMSSYKYPSQYAFVYTPANGDDAATLDVSTYLTKNSVMNSAVNAYFDYDEDAKVYTYHTTLQQWGKVCLGKVDENGDYTAFTFDNTTIMGSIINSGDADWTNNLYLADGGWMCSVEGGVDYYFTYYPEANILSVSVPNTIYDNNSKTFGTYDAEAGKYSIDVTLALWGKADLYYTDANGITTQIKKDNTTINGDWIDNTEADWTYNLYNGFQCSHDWGGIYQFDYTPAAGENGAALLVTAYPSNGLYVTGTWNEKINANDAGYYSFSKEFANWNSVSLTYWYNKVSSVVWYDTADVYGTVTDGDNYNCAYDRLYHEKQSGEVVKTWYQADQGATTYSLTYIPAADQYDSNKLFISKANTVVDLISGAALTYDSETETYSLERELATWGYIVIADTDAEGNITFVNFKTAKVEGEVVNSGSAPWTEKLYVVGPGFMNSYDYKVNYRFEYVKASGANDATLDISTFYVANSVIDKERNGYFTYDGESGTYSYTVTLKAWGKVVLGVVDADSVFTYLTFDNTDITGTIINATDADWSANLYLADGGWMCCLDDGATYNFVYTPGHDDVKQSIVVSVVTGE